MSAGAITRVRELEKGIQGSVAKSNGLPELLDFLSSDHVPTALAALHALRRTFALIQRRGDMRANVRWKEGSKDGGPTSGAGGTNAALEAFAQWVRDRYEDFIDEMLQCVSRTDPRLQVAAWRTLMELVRSKAAATGAGASTDSGNTCFDHVLYHRLVRQLVLPSALLEGAEETGEEMEGGGGGEGKRGAIERKVLRPGKKGKAEGKAPPASSSAPSSVVTPPSKAVCARSPQLMDVVFRDYFLACFDVHYYTLLGLARIAREFEGEGEAASEVPDGIFRMLGRVKLPPTDGLLATDWADRGGSDEVCDKDDAEGCSSSKRNRPLTTTPLAPVERSIDAKTIEARRKKQGRHFSDCWVALVRMPLTPGLYRRLLARLPEDVLPNLADPFALCDFLVDAAELGGVGGLLALSSLFILMRDHGLDYPDFYPRLYAVTLPEVLHARHRVKFFALLVTFLRSPALPAYMVAGFVKRLARLALTAPPSGATFILPLIYELLQRHAACRPLIHRSATATADPGAHKGLASSSGATPALPLGADSFREREDKIARTGAVDSSLWELVTLRSHYDPTVATLAKIFSQKLLQNKFPVDDFMSETYKSMFTAEVKRGTKATATAEATDGDDDDGEEDRRNARKKRKRTVPVAFEKPVKRPTDKGTAAEDGCLFLPSKDRALLGAFDFRS